MRVKNYLKNQDTTTGEKIDFPKELLEQARSANQKVISKKIIIMKNQLWKMINLKINFF